MANVYVLATFEKKELADVVLTERSYDNHQGMFAPTVKESAVAVEAPQIPTNAILVAFVPGYFYKHNTRVSCPKGRQIARGFVEDKKQSHETLLAWLMPGEEIRYTVGGRVGAQKTFCRGIWRFDGTYLYNEVQVSNGESGPWGSRYLVHGKPGIRCVVPVRASDEEQKVAWEKSRNNATFAAAGTTHDGVTYTPDGLAWYCNFSLEEAAQKQKEGNDEKWAALKSRIEGLGLKVSPSSSKDDSKYLLYRYVPLVETVEKIFDLNKQIEEARSGGKPPFLTDYQWGRCKSVAVPPEGWDDYSKGMHPLHVKQAEKTLRLLTVPPTQEETNRLAEGKRRMEYLWNRYEAANGYLCGKSIFGNPDAFYLAIAVFPGGKSGEIFFSDLDTVKAMEEKADQEEIGTMLPTKRPNAVASSVAQSGKRASASQLEALQRRFGR